MLYRKNMETERLIINNICESDKYAYFKNIANNKNILKTFIDKYVENYEDFSFDRYLKRPDVYAIRLKNDGLLIGVILIVEENKGEVEIGYAIGEEYWNKGYTTEATKCFIDYLFNERKFKKVTAAFFKDNIGSKRVMEKSNMKYSHEEYEAMEYLGEKKTLVYYYIKK